MEKEWSDRKKFWFETLRTLILGATGAVLALLVLGPGEQSLAYRTEVKKLALRMQAGVAESFLKESLNFTNYASERCDHRKKESSQVEKSAEYAAYTLAREHLRPYIGKNENFIKNFQESMELAKQFVQECNATGKVFGGGEAFGWKLTRRQMEQADRDLVTSFYSSLGILR